MRGWIKLLSFSFALTTGLLPTETPAKNVPKYGVFELSLTASGNYSNPYLKMPGDSNSPGFVVGTFVGPNGESITTDGFWDGGHKWKIRMAPTAVGTWSYRTLSCDPGMNGATGSFNCVASSNRGFIRIHPENPYSFAFDDGTPFFWMGDMQIIFYQADDYRLHDGSFQALQDIRASQGITSLYFGSWAFRKPGNFASNEGGYNFNNSDPDRLNPGFWQVADKRLEYVVSKGMVPGLGIGWPDQGIGSFGNARLIRIWRYMIARYSAYNIMWNLFGEANDFGTGWVDKVRYFGKATQKFDPYNHVTSTHHLSRTAPYLGKDPWLNINIQQVYSDFSSKILEDRSYEKPVVNVEFGFEGEISPDSLRKRAWTILTNGGHLGYGSNTYLYTPNTPGRTYCKYLAKFFTRNTRFWKLEPHNEYINQGMGYCLANPGKEYVLYLPSGGSLMVDLSEVNETSRVAWYNPRVGDFTKKTTIKEPGIISFTTPNSDDWVLHINKRN